MRSSLALIAPAVCACALLGAVSRPSTEARADDVPGSPLAESYRLQGAGDWKGAARVAKSLSEKEPSSYFLKVRLAYLQFAAGETAAAAESYALAAGLDFNAVEPLLGEQQALVALEKWDQAERIGNEILLKDSKNYLALSRLAWTRYKKKDYKAALAQYQQLLALYPSDTDIRLGVAWSYLGLGKKSEATSFFKEVLAMVPGSSGAVAGLQLCQAK